MFYNYRIVSKDIISKVSCVLGVIFMLTLSYVAGCSVRGIGHLCPGYGINGSHIYRKRRLREVLDLITKQKMLHEGAITDHTISHAWSTPTSRDGLFGCTECFSGTGCPT